MTFFKKDFQVPPKLKKHKVSRISKEGSTILIQMNGGRQVIRFDIEPKWQKTIANFEKQSKGLITDQKLKQAIIFYLSKQWLNLLDGNGRATAAASGQREQRTTEEQEPEDLSVSEALRRKEGHVKVQGQIIGYSSVYNMISIVNLECANCGYTDTRNYSNRPVFRSPIKDMGKCYSCKDSQGLIKS